MIPLGEFLLVCLVELAIQCDVELAYDMPLQLPAEIIPDLTPYLGMQTLPDARGNDVRDEKGTSLACHRQSAQGVAGDVSFSPLELDGDRNLPKSTVNEVGPVTDKRPSWFTLPEEGPAADQLRRFRGTKRKRHGPALAAE